MNKIPRTFCITLKETHTRTREFLEEAKKHELDVELFYGVFGEKTGLRLKQLIPRPRSVKELGGVATGGAKKAFGAVMDSNIVGLFAFLTTF
jgi:hypothetical protein